jgi:hypothetical protein
MLRILTISMHLLPWSRVVLGNLSVTHLSKKISVYYGTPKFIFVFKTDRHWTLSSASLIHYKYYPCKMNSKDVLLSTFGPTTGPSLSQFPTKILTSFSSPNVCYIPPIFLRDLITLVVFREKNILWSSSLCNFVHPPFNSSPFYSNILLSSVFLNTFKPYSSLMKKHQVLQSYITRDKIIELCISIIRSVRSLSPVLN